MFGLRSRPFTINHAALGYMQMITFTFDFDSIHIGLLNAVHHCENICHLSCSHILAFPPAITNVKAMLETPRNANVLSAEAPDLPECVSNSILKVHKVFMVDPQQISAVEIQISFLKHITESLLLSLLLVPSVADKRGVFRDFPD